MKDFALDPAHLADVDPYTLLESAANAFIGVDHRFLHAIVDRPESSIPSLVRFAGEDHQDDPIELTGVLLDIFRHLGTSEALPFLMKEVRRTALDIDDELIEAVAQFGAAALDPLLDLLKEFDEAGKDAGDIPFLLTQLGVGDPRILETLTRRLKNGDADAVLFLEMYGDRAAIPALKAALENPALNALDHRRVELSIRELSKELPWDEPVDEPFDIWDLYAAEEWPPLDALNDEDRLAMFENSSADLRASVAAFYRGPAFSEKVSPRLLELAKSDPDPRVRGECWQSLEELSNEPEIRTAMLNVLKDGSSPQEEKWGAAIALSLQTDNPVVFQAVENLYADPRSRAKALVAMGRSFDRRFAEYPPRHLDDPDPDIRRQAIWAVGYLGLVSEAPRLKPFFRQKEFRYDALFAFALSVPGETSRSQIRSLYKKIDDAAGGLSDEENDLVELALDQRLQLHGKEPVFSAEVPDEPVDSEPAPHGKVGRNDPCPCGSGKKYKKCCGRD